VVKRGNLFFSWSDLHAWLWSSWATSHHPRSKPIDRRWRAKAVRYYHVWRCWVRVDSYVWRANFKRGNSEVFAVVWGWNNVRQSELRPAESSVSACRSTNSRHQLLSPLSTADETTTVGGWWSSEYALPMLLVDWLCWHSRVDSIQSWWSWSCQSPLDLSLLSELYSHSREYLWNKYVKWKAGGFVYDGNLIFILAYQWYCSFCSFILYRLLDPEVSFDACISCFFLTGLWLFFTW